MPQTRLRDMWEFLVLAHCLPRLVGVVPCMPITTSNPRVVFCTSIPGKRQPLLPRASLKGVMHSYPADKKRSGHSGVAARQPAGFAVAQGSFPQCAATEPLQRSDVRQTGQGALFVRGTKTILWMKYYFIFMCGLSKNALLVSLFLFCSFYKKYKR